MRKKLYIETSVWNQLEHDDRPEWRSTAEQFFSTVTDGRYDAYISSVVLDEILATTDEELQRKLARHIDRINPGVLELDTEAAALAQQYLEAEFRGTPSARIFRDCSHVAISTVHAIKHVVSFNCRHLVNDRRIDAFNSVNIRNGYDHIVDISTPHKFLPIPEEDDAL
jgi:predicted nucleic acid-binding protein